MARQTAWEKKLQQFEIMTRVMVSADEIRAALRVQLMVNWVYWFRQASTPIRARERYGGCF